jgi:multidrug efflux pump subunit AcrB
MRIWLDPEKTAARGISAGDVVRALREQNVQVSAGIHRCAAAAGQRDCRSRSTLQGRLATVEEFGDVIVKTGPNGELTRVRDIARVELGASEYALQFAAERRKPRSRSRSSRRRARTRSSCRTTSARR